MASSAANRVEIPDAPILETFRAVFEQAVAWLETTADRHALREAWPIVAAGPRFANLDLGRAEEILSRDLDLLDESRWLPEAGRHFLRVALLQTLAEIRQIQGRQAEATFIRLAAAGYVDDHLRLDRHPLPGFLLHFQASRSHSADIDPGADDPFGYEPAPVKAELPVC